MVIFDDEEIVVKEELIYRSYHMKIGIPYICGFQTEIQKKRNENNYRFKS